MSDCKVIRPNIRVCEKGTKGCGVTHVMDQETAVIVNTFGSETIFTVVYRMVDEDHQGRKLADSYFGVSIDGSPWYSVAQIMRVALARAEISFQEEKE